MNQSARRFAKVLRYFPTACWSKALRKDDLRQRTLHLGHLQQVSAYNRNKADWPLERVLVFESLPNLANRFMQNIGCGVHGFACCRDGNTRSLKKSVRNAKCISSPQSKGRRKVFEVSTRASEARTPALRKRRKNASFFPVPYQLPAHFLSKPPNVCRRRCKLCLLSFCMQG